MTPRFLAATVTPSALVEDARERGVSRSTSTDLDDVTLRRWSA